MLSEITSRPLPMHNNSSTSAPATHSQHSEELNKENRAGTMIGGEGSRKMKQHTTSSATISLSTTKSTTHGRGTGTSSSGSTAMNVNSWTMDDHGHRGTPTSIANSTIATNSSAQNSNAQDLKKNKNDIWSTTRNHNSNSTAVSNTVVSSSVSNPHSNVTGTPPHPSMNQLRTPGLGGDMDYDIRIDDNDSSSLTPSTTFSSSTLFSSSKGVGHSHSFEDELMIRQMMHSGERNRLEIPRLDQESDLVGIPTNSSLSGGNLNLNGLRTGSNVSHPNDTKVDANNGEGSYIQGVNGNGNGHMNYKNGSRTTHLSEKTPLSAAAKLQSSLTTTAATNTATATAASKFTSNSAVATTMNSHISIVPRNPFQRQAGENANTGVHSLHKHGQGMNMDLPQDRPVGMSGHGPSHNNMNANASNLQTPYFDQHQHQMHQIQHQQSWTRPAPAPSSGQSLSNSHHQQSQWPSSPYQPIGTRTVAGEVRQGSSPLNSPGPIKRHAHNNHNSVSANAGTNANANENQSQPRAMQKFQPAPSPSRPHYHQHAQGQGQGHSHHHQGHQQHYQPHPRISHSQPSHTHSHKLQQPSPRPRPRSSSTNSDIQKYSHNPSHSNWSQHSNSHNQHHSSHHGRGHGHGHAVHSQTSRSAHGHSHGQNPHQGHHTSHSHHSSKTVPGSPHGHSAGHSRIHHVASFSSIGGGPRPAPEVLKTLLRKKACLYEAGTSRAIALITWLVGRKLALHNGYFSRQRLQSGVHAVVAQKIDSGMITRTKVNRCMQIILNSCFHYIIPRPDGMEESGEAFRKVFAENVFDDTHLLKSIVEPWSNLDISLANEVIEGTREDETSIAVATSKGKKSDNDEQKGTEGGSASSSKRLVLLCFNENVRSAEDVLRCHNDFIRDAAISSNLHLSSEEWRYFFSRKDDDGSQTSAGCTTIESTLSGGAHVGATSVQNSPALRGSEGCDIPYLSFDISTEVSDCLAFADSMTEPWAKSNDVYGTMSNHELSKFRSTWCCKRYDHDERLCRFAHVNTNKGWLRRDPTKFEYCQETCPQVAVVKSEGNVLHGAHLNACKDGLLCKFAHSQEEVDYHPKRYKSRLCERAKGPMRCCDLLDICPNSHPNLPSHHSRPGRHGGKRHESSNPRSKGGNLGNLSSPRREDKVDDQTLDGAPVLFLSPAPTSDFEKSLQYPGLRDLYRRNCTMHYVDHLKLKGATYALFDDNCGLKRPLFKPQQSEKEGFSLFH